MAGNHLDLNFTRELCIKAISFSYTTPLDFTVCLAIASINAGDRQS